MIGAYQSDETFGKEWRKTFYRDMVQSLLSLDQDMKIAIHFSRILMREEVFHNKDVFKRFVSEMQEYIRSKLTPTKTKDGSIRWECGFNHEDKASWYLRLRNLRTFCVDNFFDYCEVIDMMEEYFGVYCYCDCIIANKIKLKE